MLEIKNTIIYCAAGLLVFIIASCDKLVEIPPNAPNQIVTSQVFADSLDAIAGVVGIYSNFNNGVPGFNIANGAVTVYGGFSADELLANSGDNDGRQLNANAMTAANVYANSIWVESYGSFNIYQVNACIEGLTSSTGISATLKNQLIGEVEFLRAMFYFNLVNFLPRPTSYHYKLSNKPEPAQSQRFISICSDNRRSDRC
jgi:hypothetical protein